MRKFTTVILATTVLLGGAYSYYWFSQSEILKNNITQTINNFNTQSKAINNDKDVISYESLRVSGFPFSMQADFTKLLLTIPVSVLVEQLEHIPNSDKTKSIVLELSYKDTVSLASNIMADNFSLIIKGDQSIKPIINGEVRPALITASERPFVCHLGIENPDNRPWNFPQVFADATSFIHALRLFECNAGGANSHYGESPDTLSAVEKLTISMKNEPKEGINHKATVHFQVVNAKSTLAYDQIANSYLQIFYDLINASPKQRSYVIDTAQYGMQNSNIEISYEGPFEQSALADPNLRAELMVHAFDLSNDLYSMQNKAHISLEPSENNKVKSAIVVHSVSNYSEKFDAALTKQIAVLLSQFAELQGFPALKEIAVQKKTDQVAMVMTPKLHDLGNIALDIDLTADTPRALTGGSITINALDITANQYGLKIKGNASAGQNPPPTADVAVSCLACDDTVNGLGAYALKVDNAVAEFRQPPFHYVSTPLIEGIGKFLHSINETEADKNSKDVLIHVIADEKSNVTISGKQIIEVVGLFGTTIAPYLQPQPPAAQTPAVVPVVPPVAAPVETK